MQLQEELVHLPKAFVVDEAGWHSARIRATSAACTHKWVREMLWKLWSIAVEIFVGCLLIMAFGAMSDKIYYYG